MSNNFSRRKFISNAGAAAAALPSWSALIDGNLHTADSLANAAPGSPAVPDRIVDIHVHFDEKNPNFIGDFLKVSEKLNLALFEPCGAQNDHGRNIVENAWALGWSLRLMTTRPL